MQGLWGMEAGCARKEGPRPAPKGHTNFSVGCEIAQPRKQAAPHSPQDAPSRAHWHEDPGMSLSNRNTGAIFLPSRAHGKRHKKPQRQLPNISLPMPLPPQPHSTCSTGRREAVPSAHVPPNLPLTLMDHSSWRLPLKKDLTSSFLCLKPSMAPQCFRTALSPQPGTCGPLKVAPGLLL